MKIALINNLYKPYQKGGAEKVVEMTARGLQKRGHDVFIISASRQMRTLSEEIDGIKIWRVYAPNLVFYGNLHKLSKPLRIIWHLIDIFNFCAAWKIKKIISQEKPDCVFLHNLKGLGYLVPAFLKKWRTAVILHDTQLVVPSGLIFYPALLPPRFLRMHGIYRAINSYLWKSVNTAISPSYWLGEFYRKAGFFKNKRIEVIHNPAPPRDYSKSVSRLDSSLDRPLKLLFMGQLERSKGILFLLETFSRFRLPHSLIILGRGSEEAEVKNFIAEREKIDYLGWPDEGTRAKLFSSSDFLIVPSLVYENCPTVILESFSYGLPVIASEIGGIAELISPGYNGFLFEPGNAADLVKTLQIIAKFDWRELHENTLQFVKDFDLNNYLDKIIDIAIGN